MEKDIKNSSMQSWMLRIVWKYGIYLKFTKPNDFVDEIVRFVYNIIEKKYFLFKTITI